MKDSQILEWLKINYSNLKGDMLDHPSRLNYLGVAVADAKRIMLLAKNNYEVKRSMEENTLSKQHKLSGQKLTETRVRALAQKTSTVIEAYEEYIDADYKYEKLKCAFSALQSKSEMLLSLGYQKQKELEFINKPKPKN